MRYPLARHFSASIGCFMPLPGTLSDLSYLALSCSQGFDWIQGTAARAGKWFTIVAIAEGTTLSALAGTKVPASVTGMPLPVGVPLTGNFTSITLSAGQVIAYKYE